MMKIGIDNVLISRMRDLNPAFPKTYLSKKEYEVYQKFVSQDRKDDYLASRFAAKEAFVKASGKKDIKYSRVEILDDTTGRPHLYVDGVEVGQVSLTHDFIASAIVLLDD